MGLETLWLNKGSGVNRVVYPLHKLVHKLGAELVQHLPAIHALTGADTTSKVGTKKGILKQSALFNEHLNGFGTSPLTETMILSCEKLLTKSKMAQISQAESFDDLRLQSKNTHAKSLDFTKTPCSSTALREHIKRSYLQTNLWIMSNESNRQILEDVEAYGWKRSEDGRTLTPVMLPPGTETRLSDLSEPCNCRVCKFEAKCACRIKKIECCCYCKCHSNSGKACCKIHILRNM